MVRRPLFAVLVGAAMACGPTTLPSEDTGSSDGHGSTTPGTTSAPGTTSIGPTTTTTPTSGDGTTGTEETDDTGFVPEPDVDPFYECDIFGRDCPEGYKCMPWANDGGNAWTSTRCSPIAEDPGAPGDPCTVEGGGASGLDDCEAGAMCWDVDPQTNEGTCHPMCVGSEDAPVCEDEGDICSFTNGPLYICLPVCDPLAEDCPALEGCYPVGESFLCADDASGAAGAAGDACEAFNECDPGNACAPPNLVPGCAAPAGCCTSFCQTDDPMPPCLPGQMCEHYYAQGQAPPDYELLGICVLP